MKKIQNIILLGTSHIAEQSIQRIKSIIQNESPDIIAVELDKQRLISLLKNEQSHLPLSSIKSIGLQGFD